MKKYISLFLAFMLAASPISVFADISDNAVLPPFKAEKKEKPLIEKVLTSVKAKLSVPASYSKFTSNVDDAVDGGKVFSFTWSSAEDAKGGEISVSSDENGNILNYYCYPGYSNDYSDSNSALSLSRLSRKDAQRFTEGELRKLIGGRMNSFILKDQASRGRDGYVFIYERMENGVAVSGDSIRANVEYFGDKLYLSSMNAKWSNGDFSSTEGMISIDKATKAFKNASPIELRYNYLYSENRIKADIILEYAFKDNFNVYIDAFSGEKVELSKDDYMPLKETRNAGADQAADEIYYSSLTPEEQEEIDEIEGLLKPEELLSKFKAIAEFKISSDAQINSSSTYKRDNSYISSISIKDGQRYIYIMADSKTGELISVSGISKPDYDYDDAVKYSDDDISKMEQTAKEFFEKNLKSAKKVSKFDESTLSGNMINVSFQNYIDDVKFFGSTVAISYNMKTGELYSVSNNIKKAEKLPSKSKAISKAKAFDALLELGKLEPMYIINDDKPMLVYGLSSSDSLRINAESGEPVIKNDDVSVSEYSDISDHPAQEIINTLFDNGIYLATNEFKPDADITQRDYFELLYRIFFRYNSAADEERIYDYMMKNGVISASEKSPNSKITKKEAAKYLLKIADYGKVAKIPNIFSIPANDCSLIDKEYYGYCAIAYGLGVIKLDEQNKLNPDQILTKAQSAEIIYNFLDNN